MGKMETFSLFELKIVALCSILLLGLIFGWTPVIFWKRLASKPMKLILSFMNSFAGGIFLAAGFIHLIPDSQERMDVYFAGKMDYPLYMVFTCLGTLLVLSIERILASYFVGHKKEPQTLSRIHSFDSFSSVIPRKRIQHGSYSSINTVDSDEDDNNNMTDIEQLSSENGAAPYLLAVALDVHSIFAGFGLGALNNRQSVQNVLWAVLAHKGVAAYSLGLAVAGAGWKKTKAFTILSLFAVSTPLGVAVGLIATEAMQSQAAVLLQGILVGMAGGTFIFISLVEILKAEAFQRFPVLQLLFVFVGVSIMSLLALWV